MFSNRSRNKRLMSLFFLISSGIPFYGQAAGVQIAVKGTVVGSTCTVSNSNAGNAIDLGNVGVAVLGSSNSAWIWNPFSITLETCPTNMTQAVITFSGQPDPNNGEYFINTAAVTDGSPDVASNVAIQIQEQQDSTTISNGGTMKALINKSTHKGQFDLKARMISPKGRATPGKVAGHIEFTIEYQ